jgi:chemotaxis protein methyltransferase CheR
MKGAPPPTQALLDDPRFPELKAWLIQRTGLSYYQDKEADLAAILLRTLPDPGKPDAAHLQARLAEAGARELDRVIEELTIGETFFFRHTEMFAALRETVFPDLAQRKAATRNLRIWSAGCSIGAEPYSLALMLRGELAGMFADWSIHILATDINRRFLAQAEAAEYDPWALRGLGLEQLEGRFTRHGKKWQLAPFYRRDVRFRYHNLATDTFPSALHDMFGFDLIICRNVMIYFDTETITRLAEQFHRTLLPGGWLIVGHSEPHTEIFRNFRTINAPGAVLYQRPPSGVEAEAPAKPLPPFTPPPPKPKSRPKPLPVTAPPRPLPQPPPEAPADRWSQLRALMEAGRLEEALALSTHLTREEALEPAPYLYRGLIQLQAGRPAEAEKALRRCIYLRRDCAVAHFYLGLAQRNGARAFANALALLEGLPEEAPLELGGGLTAGELRRLIDDQRENSS